jgi:methyl-accepting chemotaxis protein
MASNRNAFITRLHLVGLLAATTVTAAVAGILVAVCSGRGIPIGPTHPAIWGSAVVLALGVLIEQLLVRLLLQRVLKPTGKAAVIAMQVSEGNLAMPHWAGRRNLDGLSTAIVSMVRRLQELVGSIRQYSQDAAAMAQQIAASTQQMSASTQEVATTTGDLTERANRQATVVRAAAQDAG